MADKINPTGSTVQTAVDLIPKFYQTIDNIRFIQSTIDQLVQKGSTKKITGYIGRKNAKSVKADDVFINAADRLRQNYQLEPGLVISDKQSNVLFYKDYLDFINQLKTFGGNIKDHQRINRQEFYSWDPHIDWDKFVNFQQYYWLPYGPETINIYGQKKNVVSSYTVAIDTALGQKEYVFTPNGLDRNPTLKLYRGQTYRFEIDSPGEPFSIKTARKLGIVERYIEETKAVSEFGITKGTITFTVPVDAPNLLFYVSENNVDIGGLIQIFDIKDNTYIDVETELLGKKSYKLGDGLELSNGMKVSFGGNVVPEKYSTGEFYVEGVGTSITLIPSNVLEIVSRYTQIKTINYDESPYDLYPWQEATAYAVEQDYIVINRGSKDYNPWSRYNRWFHKDVVTKSAEYNGSVVDLDQSARAKRPIIEFEANLKLFNFGQLAADDVDLIDNFTEDAFSTVEGAIGYNIDGVQLIDGMKIIFAAEKDPLIANNVYQVKFINIANAGPGVPQIHLELISKPLSNSCAVVRQGKVSQGLTYWYDSSNRKWIKAQEKTSVNQAPLFDVVNSDGISFADNTEYPGSTFSGTRIFSYAQGKGSNDAVLGFPLEYQNINNIGDIKFNFNLLTDTFDYKLPTVVTTSYIKTGFLPKLDFTNATKYVNGWQTSLVSRYQPAVRIYKNSRLTNKFPLDLYDNRLDLADLEVRIYINGVRLDKGHWRLEDAANYKIVVLNNDINLSDVLTIRSFSSQPINANGYYEVPINIQNNPLNEDMTSFTLGEVSDHVNSIIDNLQDAFIGTFPGNNNLRDLGNITVYGTKFVQHSSPGSLSLYHITSESNNIIRALEKARDDYGKFKRAFLATAETIGIESDPVSMTDAILKKLNSNRTKLAPYYFSDMIPFGGKKVTFYDIVSTTIKTYPLSEIFSNEKLSNKAVLVYYDGMQLLYGRDYTFTSDGYVNISISISIGKNKLAIHEYDSTDGCYVPPTPTKLGLWPKFTPRIYIDKTFVTPRKMIQGHDGSLILAYDDIKDQLLLELEKRIYNNIKTRYDETLFNPMALLPGYSRHTEYSLDDFNKTLAPSFYSWIDLAGQDFTTPVGFNISNAFTYNFTGHSAPDGRGVPGYWRGIYRWIFDTDRPNAAPWEMLGLSEEPSWWTEAYGPAPYTSNNQIMWEDIALGAVKVPGKPVVYRQEFAKPFLMKHLPVDEDGNLRDPLACNLAAGPLTEDINLNYRFGDTGPAEAAWRRSSYYPFSVLSTLIILKPAYVLGSSFDLSRMARNLANQLVYTETSLRITPRDIKIPSIYTSLDRIQTSGIINYLVDQLVRDNLNFYKQYVYDLANLNIQIAYRLGAFTTKANFNLLLDSKNPAASGSLFVPPEDYSIIYNSSSAVKKLSYSGIIITKVYNGFEVKGYSITDPYFHYYPWMQTKGPQNIGGISSPYADWAANQQYKNGQIVAYNGIYYRATANTLSGETFNPSSFAKLSALPVSGGVEADFRSLWDRQTALTIPYGTVLPTVQSVVDFITGYGEYLKDQGFEFQDYNNNLEKVADWETSAKEFMFWTTQNWSSAKSFIDWIPNSIIPAGSIVRFNGDFYKTLVVQPASAVFISNDYEKLNSFDNTGSPVISLSPSANKVTFTAELSVVDDINNPFHRYEILNVDGTTIESLDLECVRQGNTISYIPQNDKVIYNATFYLVQKEQVAVLKNVTMFNDVIYNPASGYRQERIKVSGFVTSEWFGGFEAPGFIFDRADVAAWQPNTDYAIADIVKYQGLYYSSIAFTPGSEKFNPSQWSQIAKPSTELVPNWTYKAGQIVDFYDLENDNFDTGQQKIAQHLLGYQDRTYLENIIQDKTSEFQFYQGYIKEKGTQNSLNKLFDVLSAEDKESLQFYEEWAVRTGQYGASNAFENIEFVIDEVDSTRNPQGFNLVDRPETTVSNFNINIGPSDVYLAPVGYNSNPFPVSENFYPVLRSPGYVQASPDITPLGKLDDILTKNISDFRDGDYIWVTFEKTSWNIYRFTNSYFTVNDLLYNESSQLEVVLDSTVDNITKGDIIGLGGSSYSGFYKVIAVTDNSLLLDAPDISNFQYTGQQDLVVYLLLSARLSSINDINDFVKVHSKAGDKVWIDDDGNSKWANYLLKSVYSKDEIINQDNIISEFKFAIVWTPNTTYRPGTILKYNNVFYYVNAWHTSGSSLTGTVILLSYTITASGTVVSSTPGQPASSAIRTITPDTLSSFGQVVVINKAGTLAAVYTAKGHVATYTQPNPKGPWVLKQVITKPFIAQSSPLAQDPNDPSSFGETMAMSKDGQWLAIGSPNAGYASYITGTNNTKYCTPGSLTVTPFSSNKIKTGAVSVYKKDEFDNFNLIKTFVTGNEIANEKFGSVLEFGDGILFVTAFTSAGKQVVYYLQNLSNGWKLNNPITAPIESPDFGKAIAVSMDNTVLAISSPTLGNLYIFKPAYTNNVISGYVLSQTISGSTSLLQTDYQLTLLDTGYGFKNKISDVYNNVLQNISTTDGTGSGMTLNLGVDSNGSINVASIQYLGSGYLSDDRIKIINPLGIGGLTQANLISSGTGYTTATNVSVGYSPLVATVSSAILNDKTFTPLDTVTGSFTGGMAVSSTELPDKFTIVSVDKAVQTNVSFNGYYMTVGSQTSGSLGNFAIGMALTGSGVSANTYIVDQQAGTWVINNSQTLGPITVTGKKYNIDSSYGSQISGYVYVDTLTAKSLVTPNLDENGLPTGFSNLLLTELPSKQITVGTFITGSTKGILTANNPLGNKAVAQTIISTTGTITNISGTGPLSKSTEFTNFSGTAPTLAIYSTVTGTISFTGSIDGTILTIATLSAGVPDAGYVLTGTNVVPGTYIVSLLSGSPTGNGSTWLVSQSQITLAGTAITGKYNAIKTSSTVAMQIGFPITFASSIGGLSISTTYYITKVIDSTLFSVGTTQGATADVQLTDDNGFSLITVSGASLPINGTFLNLVQKYSSGSGTGAKFTIIKSGGSGLYADPNSTTVILVSGGTGYSLGDTVTISGSALGGLANINDFTFTIATALNANLTAKITGMIPFNSSVVPIGANLTALGILGQLYQGSPDSVTVTGYIKTDNTVVTTSGTGYVGLVYSVSTPGLTPVLGAISNISTPTVGSVTYSNVIQESTSGNGKEAVFDITVSGSGTSYAGVTTIKVVSQGGDYNIGDTITIAGTFLGGNSPDNDLQITVSAQPQLPSNVYVTEVIDSTNYTINTSYTIGTDNFPLSTTGTQVTLKVYSVLQGIISAGQTLSGLGVTPGTKIASGYGDTWYLTKNFAVGTAQTPSTLTGSLTINSVRGDVTGSPGYGATVDIVANSSGQITSVKINKQGSSYRSTDKLVILGGNNDAVIVPQTTIALSSTEYGTLTAMTGGKILIDNLQSTGTFFPGQVIEITGTIDVASIGKITGYTSNINIQSGINKGTTFRAYVIATETVSNPGVLDGGKKSTIITLSLTKNGAAITTVPGLISSASNPLVLTLYYPGVSANGEIKITSTVSNTISSLDYGISLSLSDSSKYLAVGSNLYTGQFSQQGKVIVYELIKNQAGINSYVKNQELLSPREETGELFGSKISFMNDAETLVIYSAGASSFKETIVDAGDTTFDLGGMVITDKTPTSGRVDVFDRYNTVWIAGETLAMESRTLDGFGVGFAVGANTIMVGAPNALDGILELPAGKTYVYEKQENTFSWQKIHSQAPVPDLRKIKRVYLYDKKTSTLIKHLDILDPYYGKIPGAADQEISFKTFRDPAFYSYYNTSVYNDTTLPANVDAGQAWSKSQVGKLWWDLRTAKFIDNHSDDIVYRNSTLNTLAEGASIDIYEWTVSKLLPSEWAAVADTIDGLADSISGQPLYGDDIYSVEQEYDITTGSFVNVYYFWVKNTILTPNLEDRKLSAGAVSNLIANPKGEGYQFISITSTNSFSLNNIQSLLKSSDVVLSIEYWITENTTQNVHNQWKLISNSPNATLPESIEEKWFDSLCGRDQADRLVPDLNQPIKLRYGVENRPRQSMFVNRFEALKEFVEQANLCLAKNAIVDTSPDAIIDLSAYELPPAYIVDDNGKLIVPSGHYDAIVDTFADLEYVNVNYIKEPKLSLNISNGRIIGCVVDFAGAGYNIAPAITINGVGTGATVVATLDANGGLSSVKVTNKGQGYTAATTVSVRSFAVLVSQDEQASSRWSIYSYDSKKKIWNRTRTQSYDTRYFWKKIDWYGTYIDQITKLEKSYGPYTPINYSVDNYNGLSDIDPQVNEIVKVRNTGSSGWQLLVCYAKSESQDWTQSYHVIGIQDGTIQLNSNLYNFSDNNIGYDGFLFDDPGYDFSAAVELRIILKTLRDKIFVDTLKQDYLNLFFTCLRYAFTEQTYIDWAFKTSFVRAKHNLGRLRQTMVYTNDNLIDFEKYVDEVVPYRSTVREYLDSYESYDTSSSMISDFDLPAIYNKLGNQVVTTTVKDGKIKTTGVGDLSQYPWKNWFDNLGFVILSIEITDGGTGYLTPPVVKIKSNSGSNASARAYVANGSVNRIVILNNGYGYLEAPEIEFVGGYNLNSGRIAKATAIIGTYSGAIVKNNVVRSNFIKIKFDRISQQYFYIQLDKSETFYGNGSIAQFKLAWAPDVKVGQSSVTIDGVTVLRENYTLAIKKSTQYGYTSYYGTITFKTPPAKRSNGDNSVITVSYIKDISLLNAQDRIQFSYVPGEGALGKDMSQLMTGIDYGGVQVLGLDFQTSQGWSSAGYMTDLWDSFEDDNSSYSVTVTTDTVANKLFPLPSLPPIYTNINVYRQEFISVTSISNGIDSTFYATAEFNQFDVSATITKATSASANAVVTSTNTKTVFVTGTRTVYNYLYGPTADLSVGTVVRFISNIVGGLVLGQDYYVTQIIDSNTFRISTINNGPTQVVTGSSGANMGMRYAQDNNKVVCNSANFTTGMAIRFTGTTFGNIQKDTTYYVKFIYQDQSGFTISSSIVNGIVGNTFILKNAVGTMYVNQISASGSTILRLNNTTGLKAGDLIYSSISGAITPSTIIKSVDSSNLITLGELGNKSATSILYADIPDGTTLTFIRNLEAATDYQFNNNISITLNEPIVSGAVVKLTSYLDAVRIDDPNFGKSWTITNTNNLDNTLTAYEPLNFTVGSPINFSGTAIGGVLTNKTYYIHSIVDNRTFKISAIVNGPIFSVKSDSGAMKATNIANPNAVMATVIVDGTTDSIALPTSITLNVNDVISFIYSTSDGSLAAGGSLLDTNMTGGDLAYTSATGLNPDDIIVDGDGFVTPTSSSSPEELVTGQVVDAVAIKVFERPKDGSATIIVNNYIANGTAKSFEFGQYINTKQAILVRSNGNILTNTVDYNIDYKIRQVILTSTPIAGTLITTESFGFNGSSLLDLDYYIGDGITTEFITRAAWNTDVSILVYVDGVAVAPLLFETDNTYQNANRIALRFTIPPAVGSVLTYVIVAGNQPTYSLLKQERLATDGSKLEFELTNSIGSSLPLESNVIVRANQKILRGPNSSYFTIGSNQYKYTLDATTVQPYSVSPSQLQVYANGIRLTINKDYTVDVSGVTVAINKATYSAYKGTRLAITIANSADYICNSNSIRFGKVYTANDYVEIISAYKHDILKIERSRFKASNNITFASQDASFYKYTGILGGFISLQNSVLDESYIMVIKNNILLTPSVDFKLNPDLSSITMSSPLSLNDEIEIILFTGTTVSSGFSFMQFKDMLNRTSYTRLAKDKETELVENLYFYDKTIKVKDAGNFDKPNKTYNRPGIIEINGERIEFFTIEGNVLGQLRRGVLGTGTPYVHKKGTYVQDIGPSEIIPYTDKTDTVQKTIDNNKIVNVVPLPFIPMDVTGSVKKNSLIDNWSLDASEFGLFSKTTTSIVNAKTQNTDGTYNITFSVPQLTKTPALGKILEVTGSYNTLYNGFYEVAAVDASVSTNFIPTDAVVTGTFGIIEIIDDGEANQLNVTPTSIQDAGIAATVYASTDVILDGTNAAQNGGTVQGSVVYSFVIKSQSIAPATNVYYTISGAVPTQYNGTFLVVASTTNTVTVQFPINYGQITKLPTSIASTHSVTLVYPSDPGPYNTITTATIAAPLYQQADDIDVFVGGYDTNTVWQPFTDFTEGQIVSINSYFYKITMDHTSGATFNSDVTIIQADLTTSTMPASSVRTFFIGNTRLKKHPYEVFNNDKAPDSPAGDVSFKADFAVDTINKELVISNALKSGTVVFVTRKFGSKWAADTGDLSTSQEPLAIFVRIKPGIGYQGRPR